MGFADPTALFFTALIGVLVLLYFWEKRRRHVVIPALFLWQSLREDTLRPQRFRPDLLFLLQLLTLLCLILGLAKPYLKAFRGGPALARHILVLDTSASMQARENNATRWQLARERALQLVQRLPAGVEIMLIAAADTPEVVVPFTRRRAEIQQALQQLQPVDTGGDLSVALAYANSARTRSDLPTQVTVYSDRPAEELPPAVRSEVDFEEVGSSDENAGIEALQIFQGRFQDPRNASIEVRVRNYSNDPRHGLLTIDLDRQTLLRTGFTLAAHAVQSFSVRDLPGPGRVVAHITEGDALPLDDVAYGWVKPLVPLRVLVVSKTPELAGALQKLAAVTPAFDLHSTSPQGPFPADPVDVVIYDRIGAVAPLHSNALYIYPPADSAEFQVTGDAREVDILDWNTRHPLLHGSRPVTTQPLPRARIITPPPGSQTLLWSRLGNHEFPLAFADERDAQRRVCFAFDIDGEQLLSSDNLGLFLVFLNSLVWLAPDRNDVAVLRTGDTYTIADLPAPAVEVRDPHGATRTLEGTPFAVTPRYAGEYHLRVAGGDRLLFANFFDAGESDIGRAASRQPMLAAAASSTKAASATLLPPDFGHSVYAAGVALLLLEWLLARRGSA